MRTRKKARSSRALVAISVCLLAVLLAPAVWQPFALGGVAGATSGSITVDARTRVYNIHVPAGYSAADPLPLVLVLHGATQSIASVERMSGMSRLADREKFIAVYPSGTGPMDRVPTWNAGNCCAYALRNNVDDVGFLRALIEKLKSEYPVDAKRIYVTGISNGAMMSYRLACELSDEIAAIAPVEGAQNLDCNPSEPVSVIVFHGTADRLVPFNGGSTPFQIGPKRNDTPVNDAVGFWVRRDGCASAPERGQVAEAKTTFYTKCEGGTGVALYAIEGGRHMWPGAPRSGNSVNATEIMWSFFAQHPKP